jgi:3'(2'), 5'-bisphosphate nucleotidase
MSQFSKELSLAVDLVNSASKITEWFKNKGLSTYKKRDQSPVTMADYASQIFIISRLKDTFPEDQIIAEESESGNIDKKSTEQIKQCFKKNNFRNIPDMEMILNYRGPSSNRQWTIDPIDGTKGYMEGLTYAIGIGLMVDADPRICAICVPNYNNKGLAIFTAEQGSGAKVSYSGGAFKTIYVSSQKEVKEARMCHSLHYDLPWVPQFAEKIGIKSRIQLDSMAKLCLVADGSYDVYIKPIMGLTAYTWDYLPGDLLVREAGGKVTDLDEERLIYENEKILLKAPGILATNGTLHDEISVFIRDNFFSI